MPLRGNVMPQNSYSMRDRHDMRVEEIEGNIWVAIAYGE